VRDGIGIEQSTLRPDVAVVRQYGEAHPDAWVEVRYENEPSVRVVALFAGDDLEIHRPALRRLVAHPDRLDVRAPPWSRVRLEEILAEVNEMGTSSERGLFGQWGIGGGRVIIGLRADGERVAMQLHERYGGAVDVTVGFLHFPECVFPDSGGPFVADAQSSRSPLPDELHVTVDNALEVRSGANLLTTIRLRNDGGQDVVVSTNGQLTARVVDPETGETVGKFSGAQRLPLIRFRAPAGESVEIPLLIGTASTTPRLGYAVPPGLWAIDVLLGLESRESFRSPLLPLVVVD
jgi:hypothetical protein